MLDHINVLIKDDDHRFYIGAVDPTTCKITNFIEIINDTIKFQYDDLGLNQFYIIKVIYGNNTIQLDPKKLVTISTEDNSPENITNIPLDNILGIINDALDRFNIQ